GHRPALRPRAALELPHAVRGWIPSGILAPLARDALVVVPRLPLYPAGRKPPPRRPEPARHHGRRGPLARRRLHLRHLGPRARRVALGRTKGQPPSAALAQGRARLPRRLPALGALPRARPSRRGRLLRALAPAAVFERRCPRPARGLARRFRPASSPAR